MMKHGNVSVNDSTTIPKTPASRVIIQTWVEVYFHKDKTSPSAYRAVRNVFLTKGLGILRTHRVKINNRSIFHDWKTKTGDHSHSSHATDRTQRGRIDIKAILTFKKEMGKNQ